MSPSITPEKTASGSSYPSATIDALVAVNHDQPQPLLSYPGRHVIAHITESMLDLLFPAQRTGAVEQEIRATAEEIFALLATQIHRYPPAGLGRHARRISG